MSDSRHACYHGPRTRRPACAIVILIAFSSCTSVPDTLAYLETSGAGVVGGDYPEAYQCSRIAVAAFDGDGGDRIAGQMESGLSRVGHYRLVDRGRIASALDELGFQQSALVDESTAVRVGRIVGADCILTGAVSLARTEPETYRERLCNVMGTRLPVPSDDMCPGEMVHATCHGIRADAVLVPRLVQVESGVVVYAQTASGDASDRSCRGDVLDTPASRAEVQQEAIGGAISQIVADLTPKGATTPASPEVVDASPAPAPDGAGRFEDLGLE